MKAFLLLLAALVLSSQQPLRADDARRTELATELISLMRFESSFHSGWTSYPPTKSAGANADLTPDPAEASKALWLKMKPGYIKAYAETFTAAELEGMIAFFKSPVGQAFLDKSPELARKLAPAFEQDFLERSKNREEAERK